MVEMLYQMISNGLVLSFIFNIICKSLVAGGGFYWKAPSLLGVEL